MLSIIICNNGLGHTKRVLYILNELIKLLEIPIKINIFVDEKKTESFNTIFHFLSCSFLCTR